MRLRSAFSMLELIFVIVIMGIIGKFGTEFLAQSYNSFIFSNINNTLQSNSATTIEFIASRLQYRIKDSVIARKLPGGGPDAISDAAGNDYTVLEWVSTDIEGFRGMDAPYWSGILDFDISNATNLVSPETNTTEIDNLINRLSYGNSGIANAALYFIGSNSNVLTDYGWTGAVAQGGAMHPIDANAVTALENDFISSIVPTFAGADLSEYYKLSWTANAIVWTAAAGGTLTYFYDYQPWNGVNLATAKSAIIMQGVDTFQFMAIGSIIKVQVCAGSTLVEAYSLCKEKTIF